MANTTGKKFGGRTKGTPNKTTNDIREKYQLLIEETLEQLSEDIKALDPKERLKIIIELSKFVIPTLKATDLMIEENNEQFNPVVISFFKTDED
jgi:hypothetical protein